MAKKTIKDFMSMFKSGKTGGIADYLVDLLRKAGGLKPDLGFTHDILKWEASKEKGTGEFIQDRASTLEDFDPSSIYSQLFSESSDLSEEDMRASIIQQLIQPDLGPSYTRGKKGWFGERGPAHKYEYSDFKWDEDAVD